MESPANPDLKREIASALDWWREAGVDLDFRDEPASILTAPPAEPAAKPPVAQASPARPAPPSAPAASLLDLSAMPGDLAAFRDWWMTDPALDGGRTQGRVPPRGPAGAELMVLVGDPEASDTEILLSGAQGRLLDGFLAAAGLAPDAVYVASVLPRATPHADWAGIAAAGYGAVLSRHVALVRPRRMLAFDGNNLPLSGNVWPNTPESLLHFNHEVGTVPLFVARGLAALLERARWKAGLWQGWLGWTRAD